MQLIKDRHRFPVKELTGLGESDPPTRASEQRHSEIFLEQSNLLGQGRLSNPELGGGPGDMHFLRDGTKPSQMSDLHFSESNLVLKTWTRRGAGP